METLDRRPGEPYTYRETPSGKWFWRVPGSPVVSGPFSSHEAACDDIIIYNADRADRIIAIARVCHEFNRTFCQFLGDNSQPTWDEAPDWQRQSAIKGVEFHIANPDAGDSASHDAWMDQKRLDGWVFGTIKDAEASPPTHPCIVPFEQLDAGQQMKDRIFRSTVHNFWELGA